MCPFSQARVTSTESIIFRFRFFLITLKFAVYERSVMTDSNFNVMFLRPEKLFYMLHI
jgi:hypothetical protein